MFLTENVAYAIVDYCRTKSTEAINDTNPDVEHYILDGESLLHRLPWKRGDSYGAIAQSYADFTIAHYGLATVVFDGYVGDPSIKDNTHQRRGQYIHPVVKFTAETEFFGKRDEFLSRVCNKQHCINLLSAELKERGCNIIQASGDADVDIVKPSIETARHKTAALIGEDTDLLILLLYQANANFKDLYFYSDIKAKETKVYHINCMKNLIGNELCAQLLFIHAFTGCNTTSRIFGIGKKSVFQKLLKGNSNLQSCANIFVSPNQSIDSIAKLGLQAMSIIFEGGG
ncbi:unnamed protein product [Meganyctiphanes norvegica]|uniref:Uncharacterized protein n=1 Tax=Meganyctiphanes norvegica TaxID=48144 RepID=A0AAV2PIX7_MEGNR